MKKLSALLLMLMLCLACACALGDTVTIPSAVVASPTLDEFAAHATITDYNQSSTEITFSAAPWPTYTFVHLFYHGTEKAYDGCNYAMVLTDDHTIHLQLTVRYDDRSPGPCWYFVEVQYPNGSQRNNITYHYLMDGTLEYISLTQGQGFYYMYPQGSWDNDSRAYIFANEWYQSDSSTNYKKVAADASTLNIYQVDPYTFNYTSPAVWWNGEFSVNIAASGATELETCQSTSIDLFAYGARQVEVVYDHGEGTEEVAEVFSDLRGSGKGYLYPIAPINSETRRYWIRATYTDGSVKESDRVTLSYTAPNGAYDRPEISVDTVNNTGGSARVIFTVTDQQPVRRYTMKLFAARQEEPLRTYTLSGTVGQPSTWTINSLNAGRYTVTVTPEGQGYEAVTFTESFRITGSDEQVLSLSEGMREIGDEAFMDTAVTRVVVPAGMSRIGVRAFADCPNLEEVEFASDDVQIDDTAIPQDVIIVCHAGSQVEAWALSHGYTVEAIDP
ncbi:MAG: leucine-rich repeat protein [Clostridia bacterium]|nr:leucine-rich repeat protein [Clostridia bacterium]